MTKREDIIEALEELGFTEDSVTREPAYSEITLAFRYSKLLFSADIQEKHDLMRLKPKAMWLYLSCKEDYVSFNLFTETKTKDEVKKLIAYSLQDLVYKSASTNL